jgi:hypothetical protein
VRTTTGGVAYTVEQPSGASPRRVKTKPILASSATKRKSALSAIVMPTPTAVPLRAAMQTLRQASMLSTTRPAKSRPVCERSSWLLRAAEITGRAESAWLRSDAVGSKSAPAQKKSDSPPVSTMAFTVASTSAAAKNATNSSDMRRLKPLRRVGRFSVSTQMPSASTRTSNVVNSGQRSATESICCIERADLLGRARNKTFEQTMRCLDFRIGGCVWLLTDSTDRGQ